MFKNMNKSLTMYTEKSISDSCYIKPNFDCNYSFQVDLAPNRPSPSTIFKGVWVLLDLSPHFFYTNLWFFFLKNESSLESSKTSIYFHQQIITCKYFFQKFGLFIIFIEQCWKKIFSESSGIYRGDVSSFLDFNLIFLDENLIHSTNKYIY